MKDHPEERALADAGAPPVEALPQEDSGPAVGEWYWVEEGEGRWLGCVTHVGSNYAELRGPDREHGYDLTRVHFDKFEATCVREPDAERIWEAEAEEHRRDVRRLMGEVKTLAARLAVSAGSLPAAPEAETGALALRGGESMNDYKAALVRAKGETLPELFKAIERSNKLAAGCMKARLIPLRAQAEQMQPVIEAIENRIFNVELYAGLTETVEQIADGEPAPLSTPISLMQRRCYMDEECLANYRTGGMEFKNLAAFDAWLAEPENRNRILPFPRCIVAFQVRRHPKEREIVNLRDYFDILERENLDKLTFLYIRNGERLFRLNTEIDFGANLFPDMSKVDTTAPLWAKMFAGRVDELISLGEYEALREERREAARKCRAAKPEDRWKYRYPRDSDRYVRYAPTSVYYDDITRHLEGELARHNRMVLVLQGLLDRSPVLHPHPPWQLWSPEGFGTALSLVYDDSRALTPGAAPDFEAYRARLNASLRTGSVTVGQMDRWLLKQGEIESARRDRDWREKSDYRPERFHPYGDPGPGEPARVLRYQPQAKVCHFEWMRSRRSEAWRGRSAALEIRCTFSCEAGHVLNVDAYTPGDFKIFFADPRTRADYLKWAPLLLEAEEWHAGNRTLGGEDD